MGCYKPEVHLVNRCKGVKKQANIVTEKEKLLPSA
jgi:hypothetical protein